MLPKTIIKQLQVEAKRPENKNADVIEILIDGDTVRLVIDTHESDPESEDDD